VSTDIQTEINDGILTVRFNRPDKKNAITHEMYTAMADAFRSADTDRKVRVAVITGNGDAFSAGNDLKEFIESPPTDPSFPVFQFMKALAHFRKPVIAAVNGTAVGIGVTLLLHCDLVYAAPGAKLALPFVNLALVPEFGSSLLLAHAVGSRRANELLLTGETFTAEQAHADGLITGVVPADQLMATVQAKAAALVVKAPGAVRLTKGLIRADIAHMLERMEMEDKTFAERLSTPELKEAIQAFYDKRHPDYSKFD
jgi:enoyl-CoA hydratase/carnithine racemase